MAHEPLKYIVNVLEECQAHNEDDMCLGLYGMTTKEVALDLIYNPHSRWAHVLVDTEESKKEEKKIRARKRRAAGGW